MQSTITPTASIVLIHSGGTIRKHLVTGRARTRGKQLAVPSRFISYCCILKHAASRSAESPPKDRSVDRFIMQQHAAWLLEQLQVCESAIMRLCDPN
jgi:hypothetical protein